MLQAILVVFYFELLNNISNKKIYFYLWTLFDSWYTKIVMILKNKTREVNTERYKGFYINWVTCGNSYSCNYNGNCNNAG